MAAEAGSEEIGIPCFKLAWRENRHPDMSGMACNDISQRAQCYSIREALPFRGRRRGDRRSLVVRTPGLSLKILLDEYLVMVAGHDSKSPKFSTGAVAKADHLSSNILMPSASKSQGLVEQRAALFLRSSPDYYEASNFIHISAPQQRDRDKYTRIFAARLPSAPYPPTARAAILPHIVCCTRRSSCLPSYPRPVCESRSRSAESCKRISVRPRTEASVRCVRIRAGCQ